ncbi:hypothetical protein HanXRQr2_Chr02g0085111 [Helianthus annuus]|uniref:Uncharacterized protein n=1 Tax=Helianthus annuus TaxID=4232 RepID=A0A9K3JQT3_HELAN|nr:hypothetical protein HanXRQr2_Chr02g0085111 [Helianthus annuus]
MSEFCCKDKDLTFVNGSTVYGFRVLRLLYKFPSLKLSSFVESSLLRVSCLFKSFTSDFCSKVSLPSSV